MVGWNCHREVNGTGLDAVVASLGALEGLPTLSETGLALHYFGPKQIEGGIGNADFVKRHKCKTNG